MPNPIIKQLLRENLESLVQRRKDYPSYIRDFVRFAKNYLGIKGKVLVKLTSLRTEITTTAFYDLNDNYTMIYIKDRALVDIMRSIGHELTHQKQNEDGRIGNHIVDGSDGSEIENEANSIAGILIRKFGKLYPIIYEL